MVTFRPNPTATVKKPATLKDIAEQLGIAHTTVSRALGDHPRISAATKAQVQAMARRMGYVANAGARAMRVGEDRLVGLVVPDMRNEFYSGASTALGHQCTQAGYRMMFGISEDDPAVEELQVRTLRESRCSVVLFTPSFAPTAQTKHWLAQMPVVQLLRFDPALGRRSVTVDDQDGLFRATRHLLDLGHTDIAYIGGPLTISTGRHRLEGYEQALRQRGLRSQAALRRLGPPQTEFGDEALVSLLESGQRFTAVTVASVRQMLGVLRAVRRRGIVVPKDLSLVCYGDAEWFEFADPPITAVSLPVDDMVRQAAETLFSLLKDGRPAARAARAARHPPAFTGELKVRGSTAPPR